jgi:hypothetical protein
VSIARTETENERQESFHQLHARRPAQRTPTPRQHHQRRAEPLALEKVVGGRLLAWGADRRREPATLTRASEFKIYFGQLILLKKIKFKTIKSFRII